MPGSTQRARHFLDVSVEIAEDGRPDLATLRITGSGTVANRDEITQWIGAGRYEAEHVNGLPVRSQYKVRIRLGG